MVHVEAIKFVHECYECYAIPERPRDDPHVADHEHQVDAVGREGGRDISVVLVAALVFRRNELVGDT